MELKTVKCLQSSRFESLGKLAGGIAHDLNNLITGILGHVSYLRMSLPQTGDHVQSLDAIEMGSRRAASFTKQILDFARGTEAKFLKVDLVQVIKSAYQLFEHAFPKDIEIGLKAIPEEVFVFGDETQLCQLIMNLAVNACEALPTGGKVFIEVSYLEFNLSQAQTRGISPGLYAQLKIIDSGVGVPTEALEHIFEPFFTTKSKSGTGLGLATVQSIVKAHQGIIEVQSNEGVGTCFTVIIPAYQSFNEQESTINQEVTSFLALGKEEKILVVDDEDGVRTVIQKSLEHLGYQVDVADNGLDAIELCQNEPSKYNLVILDMMMPNLSGDEVFKKLRAINPKMLILIASGYSNDSKTRILLDSGRAGFIQKPFAVEELAYAVRSCLDSHD